MWIKLTEDDNVVYIDTSDVKMVKSIPGRPKECMINIAGIGQFMIPHSPEETARLLGIGECPEPLRYEKRG